jgi:hypothetical protein
MQINGTSKQNFIILLALVLLVTATLFFILVYYISGPSWDLIEHSLNGMSLINPELYSSGAILARDVTLQGNNIYYETYRAPVSMVIFAIISLIARKPIFPYLVVLYIAFIAVVYKFSKDLKFDLVIAMSVLLNPYILSIMFIGNSTEILSIIFIMVSLALIIKKSPWAGFTLGIASMAKYPNLILLPAVLLLKKPEKIGKGIALELAALAPWLLFNFILTGNPLMSYIRAYQVVLSSAAPASFHYQALLSIFIYPIILAALLCALALRNRGLGIKHSSTENEKMLAIGAFLALAVVQFLFIGGHYDVFTQVRFSYFMGLMALVALLYLLNGQQQLFKNARIIAVLIGIIALVVAIYILIASKGYIAYYNPNSNMSVYANAGAMLAKLGYGKCRIVSNSWIYMRYLGYSAYMPIGLNNTSVSYPAVIFKDVGVAANVYNISQSRTLYNNSNFSILLPHGYKCYTD